ncbi:MAG: hypothetical protein AB1346_08830 [Thermodesulfobacteriota bacterium]
MMPGFRVDQPAKAFALLSLLAAAAFAAGCSSANNVSDAAIAGESHINAAGQSVPGWVVVPTGGQHATAATQDFLAGGATAACAECHGADLAGGISKVSCFANPAGCHHGSVPGWVSFVPGATQPHGSAAKRNPGSSGFASCQVCHGAGFNGGRVPVSCFSCHGVNAPHPARVWRGPANTHLDTHPDNAPVCAECHFPGSPNNPLNHPTAPAPAGTPPGCFNNTLCHGVGGFHPENWAASGQHGPAAKGPVAASTGFAFCQTCHGEDLSGGESRVSCYPCHGVTAPHPVGLRWVTVDPPTHTNTNTGNAPVCAICHQAVPGTPGCFNGTLCHAIPGVP